LLNEADATVNAEILRLTITCDVLVHTNNSEMHTNVVFMQFDVETMASGEAIGRFGGFHS